jgi:D-proline reductase (dithiol) PrdB
MMGADQPIRYIPRTREYYRAIGYGKDYVWSCYEDVPFTTLNKPLSKARIGLVTTAHPLDLSNRDARGVKHVWSGEVDPLPAGLNTDNLAWDRESTHTQDRESFLPLEASLTAVREGIIGSLTPRFYGAPTEYSQRKTIEEDAPKILALLQEDGADAALISAL